MLKMKSTGNGAAAKYRVLSLDDIKQFLRTSAIDVAEDAYLFCWTTNAFVDEAHDVVRAWGFVPKTMATWVKGRLAIQKNHGWPDTPKLIQHIGQGRHLRNTTEHAILGVRGKMSPLVRNVPTAFVYPARWPGRKHSEKPPVLHDWSERLSDGPRLEIFARTRRSGWDALGDEL